MISMIVFGLPDPWLAIGDAGDRMVKTGLTEITGCDRGFLSRAAHVCRLSHLLGR